MNKVTLLLLFLLTASHLYSQDTKPVQPNSGLIRGDFIQPYTNKWKVSRVDSAGNKQLTRYWTDYAHILELDGIRYLNRVQDLYSPTYELQQTWINVVRQDDLTPVRYSIHGSDGNESYTEYDGTKILYKVKNDVGDFVSNRIKVSQILYDWNLYGMLLVGLPFEKNMQYEIPIFSESEMSEDTLFVSLEEQEVIHSLSGREYKTTKFKTDKKLIFWLTKEEPYVIQLVLELSGDEYLIWEKI